MKIGNTIEICEEYRDPGDDEYTWVIAEILDENTVRVEVDIPGFGFKPNQIMSTYMIKIIN